MSIFEPGSRTTRMSEALYETDPNGVSHVHKNEGDRRSGGVYRNRILWPGGDDNFWAARDEFGHESWNALFLALRVTKVDFEILSHDVTARL